MARRAAKPSQDTSGRWRNPDGSFAPAPKPKKKSLAAKRQTPPAAAAPTPKNLAWGALRPEQNWGSLKPLKEPWGRRAGLPESKRKARKKPVAGKPLPPPVVRTVVDLQHAHKRASQAAARVQKIARDMRAQVDEALLRAATDPKHIERIASNPDLAVYLERQSQQANRLDLAAQDRQREVQHLARLAIAAQREATARRRAGQRANREELEAVAEAQQRRDAEAQREAGERAPKSGKPIALPKGGKLTDWQKRLARAELMGWSDDPAVIRRMAAGRPDASKGEISISFFTKIRKAVDAHRDRGWSDELEAMRDTLLRRLEGNVDDDLRGKNAKLSQSGKSWVDDYDLAMASAFADFLEAVGMQRSDGYTLYFKY